MSNPAEREARAYGNAIARREEFDALCKELALKQANQALAFFKAHGFSFSDFHNAYAKKSGRTSVEELAWYLDDNLMNAFDRPDPEVEADAAYHGTHWTREAAE